MKTAADIDLILNQLLGTKHHDRLRYWYNRLLKAQGEAKIRS